MKIVLLGYMASGKSTIGRALAEKLSLPFIDLDDYIEKSESKKVSEIFSEKGEIYFRTKEHEYLKELLDTKDSFILSLGGGTPCYSGNMDILNQYELATSFYIKASVNTLCERLIEEKEARPLVKNISNEDLPEFIAKHLFERSFFYEQADYNIKTDALSVEEIIKEITELL